MEKFNDIKDQVKQKVKEICEVQDREQGKVQNEIKVFN